MKSCAYCGRKNADNATHCCECGTAQFVLPASPIASPQTQAESIAEVPDPECDVPAGGEAALCTHCLFPNLPDAPWCKRCGAPISYASIVGPQDAAFATGFMWRGAVQGRPKTFVFVAVWALFFPNLLVNLLAALSILTVGMNGLLGLVIFWVELAFAAIAFMMLYQVTRNYLTIPPMGGNDPPIA